MATEITPERIAECERQFVGQYYLPGSVCETVVMLCQEWRLNSNPRVSKLEEALAELREELKQLRIDLC